MKRKCAASPRSQLATAGLRPPDSPRRRQGRRPATSQDRRPASSTAGCVVHADDEQVKGVGTREGTPHQPPWPMADGGARG
eukprot:2763253-Prymnesium_polylepis.1